MFCKTIEELSMGYIDNELGQNDAKRFLKHLCKCKTCRMKYNLIKSNYTPEKDVENLNLYRSGGGSSFSGEEVSLTEKVMGKIDKSMYDTGRRRFHRKRVTIAIVCILLLLTASINAESLYKSYQELADIMFISKERLMGNLFKNAQINRLLEDEEYINQVYSKYSDGVEKEVDSLKIGAAKVFEFEEENGIFRAIVAKGEGGVFISYGFLDHKLLYNDYVKELNQKNLENILQQDTEHFNTVFDLANSGEIAVDPGYVPYNYELVECFRSLNPNSLEGSIGIRYAVDEENWVNFMFITGRMVESSEGPGELIEISGRQAFYNEQMVNGRNMKQLSVYLGDGTRYSTLVVYSAVLDKQELLKIVENIELLNENANSMDNNPDYFVNIKDKRVLEYTDQYISNIKRGNNDFTFKIDEHTEFYKRIHNNTYYIHYRNVNYNDIKELLYYPLNLDEKILEEYDLASAQVFGKPYISQKDEAYNFKKGDSSVFLKTDIMGLVKSYTNKTDALIKDAFGSLNFDEYQPYYGKSGQLYYFFSQAKHNEIRTVYEIDGYLYRSIYILSSDFVKNPETIQSFVDSL